MGRTHVVLVPGFGGFDALGELEYYAGITPIFETCSEGRDASLHYFDNLPTAAVKTRAKALRAYLTKRVERCEIRDDDRVVLVGHSTGGLDIRAVVDSLSPDDEKEKRLLDRIQRVVYLSVPQRGTNIADWVAANRLFVDGGVRALRTIVGLHAPESIGDFIFDQLAKVVHGLPDIVEACHDVGRETGARKSTDPWIAAQARQALADLELWLENMGHDFFAIEDLRSGHPKPPTADAWKTILTRSYATIGERPFDATHFEEPGQLRSLPSVLKLAASSEAWPESDVTYRLCYAACSAGPFTAAEAPAAKWLGKRRPKTWTANGDTYAPKSWENDGIVNTASMFWPNGSDTHLVLGDHGDIIGHFDRHEATAPPDSLPRRFDAYDLLGSHSSFKPADLVEVWTDVFAFALDEASS